MTAASEESSSGLQQPPPRRLVLHLGTAPVKDRASSALAANGPVRPTTSTRGLGSAGRNLGTAHPAPSIIAAPPDAGTGRPRALGPTSITAARPSVATPTPWEYFGLICAPAEWTAFPREHLRSLWEAYVACRIADDRENSEKQEAEVPDTDWIRIDDYECHVDFPPDIAGRIRQSVRKLLWENGISRNLREAIARNITISTKGTWAGYQLEHVTVHTKLWCPFAAPTGLEAALNMRRKRTEFLFVLSIRPLLSDQDWTMVASNLYEAPPQLNDAAMDLRCWEPVEHRRADGLSKINTKRIREHLFADFDGYTTELIPDHVLWLLLFSSVGVLEFDIGEREANTDDCWLVQRVRKQFDPDCDGCGDAYDVAAAKEKWGSKVLEELEVEDHLDLQPSQVWDFLSKQGGAPAL